eukprot:GHVU01025754.1.p2 GENE.GHVU01025754.1~~GHVU01025754.1.p2  ORF type:complete len:125 (-),score=28.03 GHVU01025754.1:308-682(-)
MSFDHHGPTQKPRLAVARFVSTCKRFENSLADLLRILGGTSIQFIRCFTPNSSQLPNAFDGGKVLEQMKFGGTVEMVKIMRDGHPTRVRYADLAPGFRKLFTEALANQLQDRPIGQSVSESVSQ